jgi:hypothetical protein
LERNRVTDYYECTPKFNPNKVERQRRSTVNFYVSRLPSMDALIKTPQNTSALHLCAKI